MKPPRMSLPGAQRPLPPPELCGSCACWQALLLSQLVVRGRGGESGRKNIVNLKIEVVTEVFHAVCPEGPQSESSEQLVLEAH